MQQRPMVIGSVMPIRPTFTEEPESLPKEGQLVWNTQFGRRQEPSNELEVLPNPHTLVSEHHPQFASSLHESQLVVLRTEQSTVHVSRPKRQFVPRHTLSFEPDEVPALHEFRPGHQPHPEVEVHCEHDERNEH